MKVCKNCHKKKPKADFYSSNNSKDGLQGTCKDCMIEKQLERYHSKKPISTIGKICKGCNRDLSIINYLQSSISKDGTVPYCLDCIIKLPHSQLKKLSGNFYEVNSKKLTDVKLLVKASKKNAEVEKIIAQKVKDKLRNIPSKMLAFQLYKNGGLDLSKELTEYREFVEANKHKTAEQVENMLYAELKFI
jgi:hypothetical protein